MLPLPKKLLLTSKPLLSDEISQPYHSFQFIFKNIFMHSHFAVMWLACSTKRKQTTNTKGKRLVCEQLFLWEKHYATSQKMAAEETILFVR